jgi:hypothetical protein
MASNEQAVRDAAAAFKMAIVEATAAGYRVDWSGNLAGLDTIAISETGAVKRAEPEPAVFSRPDKPFDDTSI